MEIERSLPSGGALHHRLGALNMRGLLPLVLGALAACPPMPVPPDAGCGSLDLVLYHPSALIPEGEQEIVLVPFSQGIDASVEFSVSGTSLGTQSIATTARWKTALARGDQEFVADVQCGGDSWRRTWTPHVYPRRLLTESVPRECTHMLPMTGGFDCDGVAIDFAGTARPGFVSGTTTRVFPTPDGGWGRWVLTDAGLLRELNGVTTNAVPFPDTDVLVATESFASTVGLLVLVEDGGLRSVAVDAGINLDAFSPCAATQSTIAWCYAPFVIFEDPDPDVPWFRCSLSGECSMGGLGLLVMQDLRSGLVTFRNSTEFIQLDLERPGVIIAQRGSRFDEKAQGPPNFRRGDGTQGRMQGSGYEAFGFLADGLETFTVVERLPKANSELVWLVDGGVTRYSRLR